MSLFEAGDYSSAYSVPANSTVDADALRDEYSRFLAIGDDGALDRLVEHYWTKLLVIMIIPNKLRK